MAIMQIMVKGYLTLNQLVNETWMPETNCFFFLTGIVQIKNKNQQWKIYGIYPNFILVIASPPPQKCTYIFNFYIKNIVMKFFTLDFAQGEDILFLIIILNNFLAKMSE